VSTSTIYTNPTIEKLSNTLYKILRTGSSDAAAEDDFMRALGEIHSDSARKTTF
jgi:hypothetical protein